MQCNLDEDDIGDEIDVKMGCSSVRQLIRRYGLSDGTVGHWISNLRDCGHHLTQVLCAQMSM